jgi:hypothetical protein
MDDRVDDIQQPTTTQPRLRPLALPSQRMSALLATVLLGIGIAAGAALAPPPDVSLAGNGNEIARRLALAALLAGERGVEQVPSARATPDASATSEPATTTPAASAGSGTAESAATETTPAHEETTSDAPRETSRPPVSSVWLIELSGSGFSAALAQPTAAPFIAQTVAQGALLNDWSALSASAFASEAALSVPPAEGGAPPLLRSIVQPPCPEGAAGQACAPETPGQLTSADEFLKTTLATITGTPAFKEHGLVVVTFATVAIATQAGLPEGTASSTLTYQPPAGALLLSPFVKAGAKPTQAFDPTSPRKSLQKLLHG